MENALHTVNGASYKRIFLKELNTETRLITGINKLKYIKDYIFQTGHVARGGETKETLILEGNDV